MLSDLTIIDLSRLMPGPFCTMLLADLGARVITIESPREAADVTATRFPSLLRNKQQVVLDLKTEAGKSVFFKLVSQAHAVVEGYRPGTLERLGVDHARAANHNPAIVYASITSYGQTDPKAAHGGHDINFLAASGLLDLMIPDDEEPTIPAVQFADMTGSMMASTAILAAIREAERTGHGRHLDVSMADGALSLAITSLTFMQNGWPYGAGSSLVGGGLACYRPYRTRDGRLLAVGALEPVFFERLCHSLGLDDLIKDQYKPDRQAHIAHELERLFAQRSYAHWVEFFANIDACVNGATRFPEAVAEVNHASSGAVRTAQSERGEETPVMGMPLPFPSPNPPGGSIPRRGEHTRVVLAELGYSETEMASLATQGVILQRD